jgi:hypothetical protein
MRTATAAGSSAAALDFKKSLLDASAVNERANQLLLENVDDQAWQTPLGRECGSHK